MFCTVIAVIAVVPCTPAFANAFRSAWIPAPPPESLPAIESTTGTRRRVMPSSLASQSAHGIAAAGVAAQQAAELELGEADHRLLGALGDVPARAATVSRPSRDGVEQLGEVRLERRSADV